MRQKLSRETQTKSAFKKLKQQQKSADKKRNKQPRLFVIDFHGDIKASAVTALREAITAVLLTGTANDECLVRVESGGGMVNAYGLAASQLARIKNAGIKLTVAVDKIAASGGYMMACVADKVIAAQFAIIGSIGVIAQLPNFHRYLTKKAIDFEQLTAGQFKRTLTMFGENTKQGREKLQQEIEDTHDLFKNFIRKHRPQVDLAQVATGEHWFGEPALNRKLVDSLQTSDDYLLQASTDKTLYQIEFKQKKSLAKRLQTRVNNYCLKLLSGPTNGGQDYL